MSKIQCDNCDFAAEYTCADFGTNPVNYCTSCLPTWLVDRAEAGHFPLMEQLPKEEKPSKKKAEAKAEETETKAEEEAPSDESN
jgi:hypothetical protein